MIAIHCGITDKDVLRWNVHEFYTKLKLLAWKAHATKEHQRIIAERNKPPKAT